MKKVEFVRITTHENVQKGAYFVTEGREPKYLKGRFFIVCTDVFGVPYTQDITQMMKKYTCGQMVSSYMVENISRALRQMEFFIEEQEGQFQILELEKKIKKASRSNGYA